MLEQLSQNLYELLSYLWDANKRIFYLYFLSAGLFAFWAYKRQTPQKTTSFVAFLFPKTVWLAHTAIQDYVLMVSNKLIRATLIVPILLSFIPIAIGFSSILETMFVPIEPITTNTTTIILSFTLLLFLFDDFSRFLLHWLLHKVPFLWSFHQVHHSAEVLTPFTIYRSHPFENLLYAQRMAIAQGAAVGLSYYLFGPTLKMVDILGANLFVFIFNMMGSNLRHSHIWFSWGKLEYILISPAQHQLHHSSAKEHIDCNLGTALSIWDRVFGTWLKSTKVKPESLVFGLTLKTNPHSNLIKIYIEPFVHSFKQIIKLISIGKKKT